MALSHLYIFIEMNFDTIKPPLYSIDFALYLPPANMYLAIDIKMLILVVKLYVFSDYIL